MATHDWFGAAGVVAILAAYFLLQRGLWSADQVRYYALNGTGAALVLVSLLHEHNLSAFLLEAAWLTISVAGILRILRSRRAGQGKSQVGSRETGEAVAEADR